MAFNLRALICLVACGLLFNVRAAAPEQSEADFLRAAVVVTVFERFEAACRAKAAATPAQTARMDTWLSHEAVAAIRAKLADRGLPSGYRRQIDTAAQKVMDQVNAKGLEPCAAAVAVTQTSEAAFAKPAGQGPAVARRPDVVAAPTAKPVVKRDPAAETARIAGLLAQIDSFAFATRPKMGVGGMIVLDVYPIVLLRSGEMLLDVEGMMFEGGLAAHKDAHPEAWTRWRRAGGALQRQTDKGWETMAFQKTYPSLPEDFRLDGLFRHLGGAGTAAIGGTQSVAVFEQYRFFADGRVLRGGGAGASSSTSPGGADTGGGSVATSTVAPDQRGRYRIDRMLLSIRYDDGSTEQRVIITDPDDPRSVIWLDGTGYVRRKH